MQGPWATVRGWGEAPNTPWDSLQMTDLVAQSLDTALGAPPGEGWGWGEGSWGNGPFQEMVSPRPSTLDAQGQWGRGDPIFPSSFFSEQKPQTTFIAVALIQGLNIDQGLPVSTSASSLGIQWGKTRSFLLCEAHIQWEETDDPSHNEQGQTEGP